MFDTVICSCLLFPAFCFLCFFLSCPWMPGLGVLPFWTCYHCLLFLFLAAPRRPQGCQLPRSMRRCEEIPRSKISPVLCTGSCPPSRAAAGLFGQLWAPGLWRHGKSIPSSGKTPGGLCLCVVRGSPREQKGFTSYNILYYTILYYTILYYTII